MKVKTINRIILVITLAATGLFFGTSNLALASQSHGTILTNVYSSAAVCSDNGCTTGNVHQINWKPTLVGDVQPIVIDDSTGITGHAWGEQLGWINFNITPVNDITKVTINPTTGVVSGYAWATNSGWINFSPTAVNNITGVTINSNGEFTGAAWASGPNGGFIVFDCSGGATTTCVKTDWVPVPHRTPALTPMSSNTNGGVVIACTDPKALNNNTLQLCRYQADINYQRVESGEELIGGINPDGGTEYEPNVPKEFAPYVCKRYLRDYIYPSQNNNPEEVKKLQSFLIENEQESLKETGEYDQETVAAVKRFQQKYADQILAPWGFKEPTGVVGRTTAIKINLLSCAQKRGCPYFKTYMKQGDKGLEAVRIQDFLNIINAPTNGYPTNGIALEKLFTRKTFTNVKEFQSYYKDTVLAPWGLKSPTGWWYQTTRYAANKLMNCGEGEIQLDNGKNFKW